MSTPIKSNLGHLALMGNYARSDYTFERGEGVYLFDKDGRRYLDFACGIAVTGLGHAHPHVVKALKAQAETLWHVSNLYLIDPQIRLAERLVANSFADANRSLGFFTMQRVQMEINSAETFERTAAIPG